MLFQPYLDKVKSRITQTSYIQRENAGYGGEYLFTTSFFTSPDSKEDYSVISHNTDILNHHKSKEWKVLKYEIIKNKLINKNTLNRLNNGKSR